MSRRGHEAQNTPLPAVATNATSVVQITEENYDEVVRSQKVILILFWAPWSAPDRAIVPIVDAVSKDYAGRVKTGKVNVDENLRLSRKFNIKGIPTVVVLKDGSEQERIVGLVPKKSLSDLLDKQLH
ncbi:MAG TPA: thioredoxin domain-containing protein [Pyrinomonadaceae bacterium]